MIDPQTLPEAEAIDPREARAAERLADLRRLRQIGMALSEAMLARVHDAMRDHEPEDPGAVAREFDRLSRAIYRTAALEIRLDQDQAALAVRVRAERASAREEAARRRQAAIKYTSDCAENAVVDLIEAEEAAGADKARVARLYDGLSERLEDPRERDDLADALVSAVVERLCKDLGVEPDWSLWEREPWAAAERKAGAPGSPYVAAGEGPSTTSWSPSPTRWGGIDAPPLGELSRSDGGGFERAPFSAGSERGPP